MKILLLLALIGALGGCALPTKAHKAVEAEGFARGYREAVQQQYWIIQNQQRLPAPKNP